MPTPRTTRPVGAPDAADCGLRIDVTAWIELYPTGRSPQPSPCHPGPTQPSRSVAVRTSAVAPPHLRAPTRVEYACLIAVRKAYSVTTVFPWTWSRAERSGRCG